MKENFTNEEIIKAIEQAEANIRFEEVKPFETEKSNAKVLRKELKNERNSGSNKLGFIFNTRYNSIKK